MAYMIREGRCKNRTHAISIVLAALLAVCQLLAGSVRPTEPFPLQYPAYFGNRFVIPPDNPLTIDGVRLGRALFYDKRLSSNGAISCASCHEQARAFSDGRKLSIGVDGVPTKRNAMSLVNLLWVRNFFWDGRASSLEEQASVPMNDPHEMNQSADASATKIGGDKNYQSMFAAAFGDRAITGERIVKALAQFERSLISANAPYDRYLTGRYTPSPDEQRGMELFMGHAASVARVNCAHCHGSPRLMVELFHNNGLDAMPSDAGREDFTKDAGDRGRFRVPTLRNIAVTAPYMHDGRFNTLHDVLDHYSDHILESETLSSFIPDSTDGSGRRGLLLSEVQKNDIIAFLRMLTDSTFLTNRELGPVAPGEQ